MTLVVAAVQAPTLLNIWARSPKWRLEVAPLGDHEGLQEASLLTAPRYVSGQPELVLVCSPSHVWSAQKLWPRAKLVWVIHNGRREIYPDWCRELCVASVALGRRIGAPHAVGLHHAITVIVPAYQAERRFSWRRWVLWAMINRPSTRHEDRGRLLAETQQKLGGKIQIFGQDQPSGFLDDARRESLMRGSSAYVTPLPPWAGFGLSEHEMLAAGVPLVGARWGDLVDELPPAYVTLGGGPEAWALGAEMLAECGHCARRIGDMGLDFVTEFRTTQRMDHGVEGLLDTVKEGSV